MYCSFDDTPVFSSVSMTFLLKQGLEIELVFVTLERASLLLLIGAKASAWDVSERAQALEKVAGRNTDRRGSRGGKSREPRQRFGAATGCRRSTHSHVFEPPFVSRTVCSNFMWMQQGTTLRLASLGAATAGVPRPFDYHTSCITTVATRAASVKYRSTSTCIAISSDFQISVPLEVTFRARCEDTFC